MTNLTRSRSRLTPRNVLVWGVALVGVGILLLPGTSGLLQLFADQLGATGHLGLEIITIIAAIVEKLALPLGIGLVCAAIVMFHLDRAVVRPAAAAPDPEEAGSAS
ncbi:hypothetical protein [Plantibacter sp. YIM 135249]|uniref:hypothetical protein n=1 Tax=Plantibacter sp. YIM 135249 TaxID=3423918 RepID=UPI003D3328E8